MPESSRIYNHVVFMCNYWRKRHAYSWCFLGNASAGMRSISWRFCNEREVVHSSMKTRVAILDFYKAVAPGTALYFIKEAENLKKTVPPSIYRQLTGHLPSNYQKTGLIIDTSLSVKNYKRRIFFLFKNPF